MGGFLIVPGLMVAADKDLKEATGASLVSRVCSIQVFATPSVCRIVLEEG